MLLRQKDKHHQFLSDWPIYTILGNLLFFVFKKEKNNEDWEFKRYHHLWMLKDYFLYNS